MNFEMIHNDEDYELQIDLHPLSLSQSHYLISSTTTAPGSHAVRVATSLERKKSVIWMDD